MTAAVDDQFPEIIGQILAVFLVILPVQHLILTAVNGQDVQLAGAQVRRGVGRQQDETLVFFLAALQIGRRHGAAKGVAADVPALYFGVLGLDARGGVNVQHRQMEGHFRHHAEDAPVRQGFHQGCVSGVIHLAAGVEDQACRGIFRCPDQIAIAPIGECNGLCLRPVVVPQIDAASDGDGHQQNQGDQE